MNGKKLKDVLIAAKKDLEESYVIFYNDGTTREVLEKDISDRLKGLNSQFFWICDQFESACDYYGRRNNFDELDMDLKVGIMYKKKDVNPDGTIKEGCNPTSDIIHFYTGTINSFENGEQTNDYDFSKVHYQSQSFIKYPELVSSCKKEGIDYNGPENFKELVERVITKKEQFPIELSLSLVEEKTRRLL